MDKTSSMYLYVKLNWDANRFLPAESKVHIWFSALKLSANSSYKYNIFFFKNGTRNFNKNRQEANTRLESHVRFRFLLANQSTKIAAIESYKLAHFSLPLKLLH